MDPAMIQPQKENKGKENNLLENVADGSLAMTPSALCSRKKTKSTKRRARRHNATESNGNLSVDPVMRESQVENAVKENIVLGNDSDGSPAMKSTEVSSRKKDKRNRGQESRHNAIESNGHLSGVPKDTFLSETSMDALAMPPKHPAQNFVDPITRHYQVENATKEKNVLENVSDGSAAMTSAEVSLRKKDKRKRSQERGRNAIESNDNLFGGPRDTASTETSTAALAMPPQHLAQHSVDPVTRQSQVENVAKEKRKRESRHNAIENKGNLSAVPEDTFSAETSTAALAMPPQHPAQCFVDPTARQYQVENAAKDKNVLEDAADGSPATTNAEVSLREKNKRRRQGQRRLKAIESNGNLSGVPKDTAAIETSPADVTVMPPEYPAQYSVNPVTMQCLAENEGKDNSVLEGATDGSSAMTNVDVNSRKKNKRRKRQRIGHNEIENNVNFSGVSTDNFSLETSMPTLDIPPQLPGQGQYSMDPVMRQSQEENEVKVQKMIEKTADGSPAMTKEEIYSRKKDRKRWRKRKTRYNDIECDTNLSEVPKDTLSPETSMPTLDMPSQYPVPYSMNIVMSQCQEVKKGKEQHMIERATDGSPAMGNAEVNLRKKNKRSKRQKTRQNAIQSNGNLSGVSEVSHLSLGRTIMSYSKKKLLVLDLNGLLVDFVPSVPEGYKPDKKISNKAVFKRPFCDDFLKFCFDRFHVGIWSSRQGKNVHRAVRFLMENSASKLLFCWNQYHCTRTKVKTIEDKRKQIVFKELGKLWEKLKLDLPWEKGQFNESNTLLLDDLPYKGLRNPIHTAIFPYSYRYSDTNDKSLGRGGDLRVYLEGLAEADNVREYVASHPFGQPPITESHPNWDFYRRFLGKRIAFLQPPTEA